MPVINIKIAKGRSIEQKQNLVEKLTKDVSEILDVKKEWITILIDEYERDNWASDGVLHSIKFRQGFGKKGVED